MSNDAHLWNIQDAANERARQERNRQEQYAAQQRQQQEASNAAARRTQEYHRAQQQQMARDQVAQAASLAAQTRTASCPRTTYAPSAPKAAPASFRSASPTYGGGRSASKPTSFPPAVAPPPPSYTKRAPDIPAPSLYDRRVGVTGPQAAARATAPTPALKVDEPCRRGFMGRLIGHLLTDPV